MLLQDCGAGVSRMGNHFDKAILTKWPIKKDKLMHGKKHEEEETEICCLAKPTNSFKWIHMGEQTFKHFQVPDN